MPRKPRARSTVPFGTIVARAAKHAIDVLQSYRDLLDNGAKALLDKETL
jgi:ATP-dependent Zn protease